jgi:tetratricopeptide (TPR) repeat protein
MVNEQTVAAYNKAIALDPNHYDAWNNKASALNNLGRYREALESSNRAIEIQPDYHWAWASYCYALNGLKRYDEAIIANDKAISIKPDYHEIWKDRGVILTNLEQYDEAIGPGIPYFFPNPLEGLARLIENRENIIKPLEGLRAATASIPIFMSSK